MKRVRDGRRIYAGLLLGGIVLGWGINWPVMKIGLQTIPPFTFALLRVVIGMLVLAAVAAGRKEFRVPARSDIPIILSVGLLQLGAFLVLINLAVPAVGAGRSAILAYTTPLWVTPLLAIVLHETISLREIIGVVVGLFGLFAILHPSAAAWATPESRHGVILLLLAAFAWACAIVHVKSHHWHGTSLSLMPWQLAVAAVPIAMLTYAYDRDAVIAWSPRIVAVVLYSGLVATAFCYWAIVVVNRVVSALTTSMALLAVPIIGVLLGSITLGERIGFFEAVGMVLVVAGVTCAIHKPAAIPPSGHDPS